MQEITQFIFQESNWVEVIFACVFSLGIALFYTIFISTHYKEVKPNWVFFALFPFILIASKVVFKLNAFFVILFLFLLLVLLATIGGVLKGLKSLIKTINKRSKKEKKSKIYLDIIKNILIVIAVFTGFGLLGSIFILIIIVVGFVYNKISPNSKNKFLRLQANLPSSKIQSMAMGLVELKGTTIMQEPLLSRIGEKQCIGYRYKIERKRRDSDGKTSYTTISDEVVCNNFLLKDSTAQVEVVANEIDFLWLEKDDSYSSASKRYTQYLLFDNDAIILIGKASSKANRVYIEKEPIKNIFMLAPYNTVAKWNRNKPLLNSFLTYLAVLFLIIAFILIAEINLTEDMIYFKFNLSWDAISIANLFN